MKSVIGPLVLYLATAAFCVAIVAIPSCSGAACTDPKNAGSATCNIINAVVDCTNVTSLPSAVAVAAPIVDGLITTATQADGSIAWASIESQIEILATQYGMCVIAQIWDDYMNHPAPPLPPGGQAPPVGPVNPGPQLAAGKAHLSAGDAKAEFARIRAHVAPGKSFKVKGGVL